MTKMLASVTGVEEAEIAISGGADIVDLKDPAAGALGAVATDTMAGDGRLRRRRRATSAVCGDLPMLPEALLRRRRGRGDRSRLRQGGFFPSGDAGACATALAPLPTGPS